MASLNQRGKQAYKPSATKKGVSVDIVGMGSDIKSISTSDNYASLISNFVPGKGSEWEKRPGTLLMNSVGIADKTIEDPEYSFLFEDQGVYRYFVIKNGVIYNKKSIPEVWFESEELINYNYITTPKSNKDSEETKSTVLHRRDPNDLTSYVRVDSTPANLSNTDNKSSKFIFGNYAIWTIGQRILVFPINGHWKGVATPSGDFLPYVDEKSGIPTIEDGKINKYWIEITPENLDTWKYSEYGDAYNVNFLSSNPGYRTQAFIPNASKSIIINQGNDGELTNLIADQIFQTSLMLLDESYLASGIISESIVVEVTIKDNNNNRYEIATFSATAQNSDFNESSIRFDFSSSIPLVIERLKELDSQMPGGITKYLDNISVNISFTGDFDPNAVVDAKINIDKLEDFESSLDVIVSVIDKKAQNNLVNLTPDILGFVTLEYWDETVKQFKELDRVDISSEYARTNSTFHISFNSSWSSATPDQFYRVVAYYTNKNNLPNGSQITTHKLENSNSIVSDTVISPDTSVLEVLSNVFVYDNAGIITAVLGDQEYEIFDSNTEKLLHIHRGPNYVMFVTDVSIHRVVDTYKDLTSSVVSMIHGNTFESASLVSNGSNFKISGFTGSEWVWSEFEFGIPPIYNVITVDVNVPVNFTITQAIPTKSGIIFVFKTSNDESAEYYWHEDTVMGSTTKLGLSENNISIDGNNIIVVSWDTAQKVEGTKLIHASYDEKIVISDESKQFRFNDGVSFQEDELDGYKFANISNSLDIKSLKLFNEYILVAQSDTDSDLNFLFSTTQNINTYWTGEVCNTTLLEQGQKLIIYDIKEETISKSNLVILDSGEANLSTVYVWDSASDDRPSDIVEYKIQLVDSEYEILPVSNTTDYFLIQKIDGSETQNLYVLENNELTPIGETVNFRSENMKFVSDNTFDVSVVYTHDVNATSVIDTYYNNDYLIDWDNSKRKALANLYGRTEIADVSWNNYSRWKLYTDLDSTASYKIYSGYNDHDNIYYRDFRMKKWDAGESRTDSNFDQIHIYNQERGNASDPAVLLSMNTKQLTVNLASEAYLGYAGAQLISVNVDVVIHELKSGGDSNGFTSAAIAGENLFNPTWLSTHHTSDHVEKGTVYSFDNVKQNTSISEFIWEDTTNQTLIWGEGSDIPMQTQSGSPADLWSYVHFSVEDGSAMLEMHAEMFSGTKVNSGSIAKTGSWVTGYGKTSLVYKNARASRTDTLRVIQFEDNLNRGIQIVEWIDANGKSIGNKETIEATGYSTNNIAISVDLDKGVNPIEAYKLIPMSTPNIIGSELHWNDIVIDIEASEDITYTENSILSGQYSNIGSTLSSQATGLKGNKQFIIKKENTEYKVSEQKLYDTEEGEWVKHIHTLVEDDTVLLLSILNGVQLIQQEFKITSNTLTSYGAVQNWIYEGREGLVQVERTDTIIVKETSGNDIIILSPYQLLQGIYALDGDNRNKWVITSETTGLDIDTTKQVVIWDTKSYFFISANGTLWAQLKNSALLQDTSDQIQKLTSSLLSTKFVDAEPSTINMLTATTFDLFDHISTTEITTAIKNIARTCLYKVDDEYVSIYDESYDYTMFELQHYISEVKLDTFGKGIFELIRDQVSDELIYDFFARAVIDEQLYFNYNLKFNINYEDEHIKVTDSANNRTFQNSIISQLVITDGIYSSNTETFEKPFARVYPSVTSKSIESLHDKEWAKTNLEMLQVEDTLTLSSLDEVEIFHLLEIVALEDINTENVQVWLEKALDLTSLAENDYFKLVSYDETDGAGYIIEDNRFKPYIQTDKFVPPSTGRVLAISIMIPRDAAFWMKESDFPYKVDDAGNPTEERSIPSGFVEGKSKWIKPESFSQLANYTLVKIIETTNDEREVDKYLTMQNKHIWVSSCEFSNRLIMASKSEIYISEENNPFNFPAMVTNVPKEFGDILKVMSFQGMLMVVFQRGFAMYEAQQTSSGIMYFSEPKITNAIPTVVNERCIVKNATSVDAVTLDGIFRIYQYTSSATGIPALSTTLLSKQINHKIVNDIANAVDVSIHELQYKTLIRITGYESDVELTNVLKNKVYVYDARKEYEVTKTAQKWYVWESSVFDFDQVVTFAGDAKGEVFFTRKGAADMLRLGYTQLINGAVVPGFLDRAVLVSDGESNTSQTDEWEGYQIESILLTNALNTTNEYDLKIKVISSQFNHYGFSQSYYRKYYMLQRKGGQFADTSSKDNLYEVVNVTASSGVGTWSINYNELKRYDQVGFESVNETDTKAIFDTTKYKEIETYDRSDYVVEDKKHVGSGRTAQLKYKLIHTEDRPFAFKGIRFVIKEKKHK